MNWKTEALIQRTLVAVPFGRTVYYVGQRLAGNLRSLKNFTIGQKIEQGLILLDGLEQAGHSIKGKRTVELGTGVSPVLPLFFWLCGQESCQTRDIVKLVREHLIVETATQLLQWCDDPIVENKGFLPLQLLNSPKNVVAFLSQERLELLRKMLHNETKGFDILKAAHIAYQAPVDTGETGIASNSADIVYSNAVFEHIPQDEILRVLAECHRLLEENGVTVHQIDMSDHFSHSDSSISPINYLTFSNDEFAKYNNDILFQNRLRASQYKSLFNQSNFEITNWEAHISKSALASLTSVDLHADYQALAPNDICTVAARVVASKRMLPN